MGGVRVTQRLLVNRVLSNLNQQSRRISNLQEQLSTGLRVNRPSDDPLAVRRAVNAQSEIGKNEQYLSNITSIGPQLRETETAVQSSVQIIQRMNEITLQANNGTNTQAQRDQLATEVNELLEDLLTQGNRTSNGRFVFGGSRTQSEPMLATRDGAGEITAVFYAGDIEQLDVEISEGLTVASNQPGLQAFFSINAQTVDIYQTLIDIRDAMRAGDFTGMSNGLGNLETAQEQLSVVLSRVGAVQNRLERADTTLTSVNLQLEETVSDNIDADFAEVALNLNAQTNAFQAALNAGARVIQPSLLDFVG
jgi:flagellar hook-associated protein 3 FlgL